MSAVAVATLCAGSAVAGGLPRATGLRRTPRPPRSLAWFSPISSTPASSSAWMTFISVSTTPLTTPSLASMRWMVGSETPARSASVF